MSGSAPSLLAKVMRDIRLCIGFYTILPVGTVANESVPDIVDNSSRATDFGWAQWAAPVAGAVIGCLAGGVFALAQFGALSNLMCAALALSTSILLTGALHEDGLADVADGFGGGRTVARKLAIMKDSCIGTYGVMALIASFTLRLAALTALGEFVSTTQAVVVLVGAHSGSRALIPLFMRLLPPARTSGLAVGLGAIKNRTVIVALALGTAGLLACGVWTAMVAIVLLAVWIAGLRWVARSQINGLTGDVLGTAQQGGEIIILIAAAAVLH